MAKYFSVPHLGAGSPEVENLGCYFFRLAEAHCCTQWQLAAHLTAWWRHRLGTAVTQQRPFSVIGTRTLSMCGYGEDVQRLVTALSDATDLDSLRAGTLLSLREVAARQAMGTLRRTRAWCPICYQEDRLASGQLYDRLLWVIAPIQRCAVHKIALFDACPVCRHKQLYTHRCVKLDQCTRCGYSLLGQPRQYVEMSRPTHGENLIHDLIAAGSADSTLTLGRKGMRLFYREVRKELPATDPLRSATSLGSASMLPTLETMLRMATAFNVSLLDFQGDKLPPTTRCLYSPSSLRVSITRRGRAPPCLHRVVRRALVRALASQVPLKPYSHFCQALHISKGLPRYSFPELTKRYIDRRKKEAVWHREKQKRDARRAREALITRYKKGEIAQKKQLERAIAKRAAVSIVLARRIIADLERSSRHTRAQRPRPSSRSLQSD